MQAVLPRARANDRIRSVEPRSHFQFPSGVDIAAKKTEVASDITTHNLVLVEGTNVDGVVPARTSRGARYELLIVRRPCSRPARIPA